MGMLCQLLQRGERRVRGAELDTLVVLRLLLSYNVTESPSSVEVCESRPCASGIPWPLCPGVSCFVLAVRMTIRVRWGEAARAGGGSCAWAACTRVILQPGAHGHLDGRLPACSTPIGRLPRSTSSDSLCCTSSLLDVPSHPSDPRLFSASSLCVSAPPSSPHVSTNSFGLPGQERPLLPPTHRFHGSPAQSSQPPAIQSPRLCCRCFRSHRLFVFSTSRTSLSHFYGSIRAPETHCTPLCCEPPIGKAS